MRCQTNRIEMPAKKSTDAKNTDVSTYLSVCSVAFLALSKCSAPRVESVGLLERAHVVFRHLKRAPRCRGVAQRVLRDPRLERGAEPGPEALLVGIGQTLLVGDPQLEPLVEDQKVLSPFLVAIRVGTVRERARRVRMGVLLCLPPVPACGLVPTPRDAQRGEREEDRGDELEHALTSRCRLTARLGELVGSVDVYVLPTCGNGA